jgi:hypothetical protein
MSKPIPADAPRITLDSTTYMLDIVGMQENGESYYVKHPQRSQPGATSEEDFWAEWTLSSFHGGERLKKILSKDDLESFRYDDAESLDEALLSKWGELKLASGVDLGLSVSTSTSVSDTLPMTVSADGTILIVGLSVTPFIYTWTYAGGWVAYSTGTIAGSGTITDLITAGTTYYAVRGGAVLTCTGAPATANWSAVGSYTTAVGVAYVNGDLFVAKSDGLYNHTDSTSISSEPLTVVAGYREMVYAGRDRRLFRYDGKAFYLYDELPQGFTMTCLQPYRDILLIMGYFKVRSGYKSAVYYIKGSGENHLYSVGDYAADYRINAAAGSDDEIFFANPKRGGADRYDLEVGGISNGPALGAAYTIPFKAMAVCEGYLFYGNWQGHAYGTAQSTGNDTTHIKLQAIASSTNDYYNGKTITFNSGTGSPATATISDYDGTTKIATISTVATPADGTTVYTISPMKNGVYYADLQAPTLYDTSGWLTTAEYDFGWSNSVKLFKDIRIECRALASGQGIEVQYSTNGGTTYTSAGTTTYTADGAATGETYTLDNVSGTTIKLKILLTGGGTNTPTLTKVVVRAARCIDTKDMWDLRLYIADDATKRAALEASYAKQTQLAFTDVDRSSTAKVIIESLAMPLMIDEKGDSLRPRLRLREV